MVRNSTPIPGTAGAELGPWSENVGADLLAGAPGGLGAGAGGAAVRSVTAPGESPRGHGHTDTPPGMRNN